MELPNDTNSLDESRFCIFVPCYHTSKFVEDTIDRIPWDDLPDLHYRVVFVDNNSQDNTWEIIQEVVKKLEGQGRDADAIRNPKNLSYGGSNKVIFDYCVANDFGLIGVLHSDGQYLPEELPRLVKELVEHPEYTMFYGSRLLGDPLEGGMPKYKYLANHFLTWMQNKILGSNLSEFHSGYRFYRVNRLKQLPYHANSDLFDFDNHIIFQILKKGWTIGQTHIPTYYGDEVSYVNPIRTPVGIVTNVMAFVLHNWGLMKVDRYDIEPIGEAKLTEATA